MKINPFIKKMAMYFYCQIICILLFSSIVTASTSLGQDIRQTKVSIKCKETRVDDVFQALYRNTGYAFVYNPHDLVEVEKINIDAQNTPLYDVLSLLTSQTQLRFVQVDKNIAVYKTIRVESKEKIKQSFKITGQIVDKATQEQIVGVNIVVEGTTIGTVSDVNGNYFIDVPSPNSVLIFSFVGYMTQKMNVNGNSVINVSLETDIKALNEVVVVGYGTIRKSDVTGSVSSIKSGDINLSAPTVGQGIVGKVAGVQVAQVSGAPYAGTKIRVRGVGSINASSDPLYVIDGYPAGNDVFLNPNDIESVDILKDAASAAIYGSRASNGVVIITTKRGKEGKGKFEYEYQFGINQLSKKIDLLNANEFAQLVIDARNGSYRDLVVNSGKTWNNSMYSDNNTTRIANVGNASSISIPAYMYDFTSQSLIKQQYDTDWQDEIYRNAMVQKHDLSFSGGNRALKYMVSGSYLDQEGIVIDTDQTRMNLRANVDGEINSKLSLSTSIALTANTNHELQEGRWDHNPVMAALIYMPYMRAYDDNGNLIKNEAASQSAAYGFQTVENPVALAKEIDITRKGLRGIYNVNATYQILPALSFKANVGMQTYNEKYDYFCLQALVAEPILLTPRRLLQRQKLQPKLPAKMTNWQNFC